MQDNEYESRFNALEYALKHLDKYDDLEYTLEHVDRYSDQENAVDTAEDRVRKAVTEGEELDAATANAFLDVLESAYVKAINSEDAERKLAAKDSKRYVKAKKEAGGKNQYRLRERIARDDDEEKAVDAGQDVDRHNLQEHEYQQDMEAILDMVDVISNVSGVTREDFLQRVGETGNEKRGYDAAAAGD